VGAPDDAEAARSELLDRAVATEHETVDAGLLAAAHDARAVGLLYRGLTPTGRVDEGMRRLHRLPRSSRTAPVPAPTEGKGAVIEKLQSRDGGGRQCERGERQSYLLLRKVPAKERLAFVVL
jgi:hypothetical protein